MQQTAFNFTACLANRLRNLTFMSLSGGDTTALA